MVKLVPSKPVGMSRRAYNKEYAKSATAKVSDTLGKLKLRSDPIKPAKVDTSRSKVPGGTATNRTYGSGFSADFGATGFTDEEFNK